MTTTRKNAPITFSWNELKKEIESKKERLTLFGSEASKQTGTAWKDLTRSEKIKMIADRADIDAVTEEMVMGVMASDEFSSSIWTITPLIAEILLKANKENRILRRSVIEQYKTDMVNGKWKQNGESICFDKRGRLTDGQHRLTAISEAGVPVAVNVAAGCDTDCFHTYDSGLNRTVSDSFRGGGVPNYAKVSTIVNRYFTLRRRAPFVSVRSRSFSNSNKKSGHVTRSVLLDEYASSAELYQEASKSASRVNDKSRVLTEGEIGGMIVYLVKDMGYRYEFVEAFFEGLATDGWCQNRAVAGLRVRLTREAMSKNSSMSKRYKQALIIKTWNIYASGRDVAPRLCYDEDKEGKIWFNHA